jgi:hypothetical protein
VLGGDVRGQILGKPNQGLVERAGPEGQ